MWVAHAIAEYQQLPSVPKPTGPLTKQLKERKAKKRTEKKTLLYRQSSQAHKAIPTGGWW